MTGALQRHRLKIYLVPTHSSPSLPTKAPRHCPEARSVGTRLGSDLVRLELPEKLISLPGLGSEGMVGVG